MTNEADADELSPLERVKRGGKHLGVGLWKLITGPLENASQGAVRAVMIGLAILSLVVSLLEVRLNIREIVLPQIPNSALISVVIAMVLVQTYYHRRRFIRVEEEINAMEAEILEADGGEDTTGNVLLAVAGFFLGLGIGEIYIPEYALPIAFLSAFLLVQWGPEDA